MGQQLGYLCGMQPYSICRAHTAHAPAIAQHLCAMALETEAETLYADQALLGVLGVLQNPSYGHYYVALAGAELAGSLLITPEWSDWYAAWYWWVQSVYVQPGHRGKGVYAALHTHARTEAQATGVIKLRLYVEQHNAPAQAVYHKLGMKSSKYVFYEQEL
jgi:GNAT superfamily N-acetyltransferase